MKKIHAHLLKGVAVCVGLALSFASCSNPLLTDGEFSAGMGRGLNLNKTFTTSPSVYSYVCDGYNSTVGPISITQGQLIANGSTKSIYLVTLSGTQLKSNQATGIINDLQAAMSIEGAYVNAIVNAIRSSVPKGSNLILAGHSLGGMVAQQVAGNSTIKSEYNVLNTICFGSPLITFIWREGTIKRLGDTSDIVPILSVSSLFVITAVWNYTGLNRENGGYGTDLLGAHLRSYGRDNVWGRYDAVGVKYGNATIKVDTATRKWFAAPAGFNWKWSW